MAEKIRFSLGGLIEAGERDSGERRINIDSYEGGRQLSLGAGVPGSQGYVYLTKRQAKCHWQTHYWQQLTITMTSCNSATPPDSTVSLYAGYRELQPPHHQGPPG